MRKKIVIFLGLILFSGFILRFYKLGDIPVGLHRDEAFLGYNAYSILQTGKDMSGNLFPLHLESFIYSPAGYSYFSIPFIKMFGLSVFSVRFAAALFGSLTILVTYFLTKELFIINAKSKALALLASLLLAISPWHINLSRTATENIIVIFFISLGVLLYLYWLRKNSWLLLLLAFASFGITILIYQAPRAFLPFFIPLMMLLLGKPEKKKQIIMSALLYVATVLLPLFLILSSKDLSLRIRTVSIFSTRETNLVLTDQIHRDGEVNIATFIARAYHNKLVGYGNQFLQNYFKHFSYDSLFTDAGYPDRYRVPLAGLSYHYELPLLILGFFTLAQMGKKGKKQVIFLAGWILLVPIGSALTFDDVPNLQRTIIVFPAILIIEVLGLVSLARFIKEKNLSPIFSSIILGTLLIYSVSFYLHQYYIHGPVYRPWYRQDGYKDLVQTVNKLIPQYKKAVITDRESAPTIFFLFYGKYDPAKFQKETNYSNMRDFDRIGFGKYEFTQEECPLKRLFQKEKSVIIVEPNTLYVNDGICNIPGEVNLLAKIRRADKSIAFHILSSKEK